MSSGSRGDPTAATLAGISDTAKPMREYLKLNLYVRKRVSASGHATQPDWQRRPPSASRRSLRPRLLREGRRHRDGNERSHRHCRAERGTTMRDAVSQPAPRRLKISQLVLAPFYLHSPACVASNSQMWYSTFLCDARTDDHTTRKQSI